MAVDTTVLVGANSILTRPPKANSRFQRRLRLLLDIKEKRKAVLISERLLQEYNKQIPRPRNDFVVAFIKMLTDADASISNYAQWRHGDRAKARKCRYPQEDDHILRTAWRDHPTTIITEEARMLAANGCIYREFRVHICDV